ncbi:quaternary amine ABC transporter ATP-binding protein [Roseofilum casamattae]|uniref:Glycine betaine/L-proline ABC transporter ATP-binding protein n=1 Tax=Roseofilum casamattae BLCC-M143 TaxID=3022442 RepID=A0ABT7BXA6_9CYAN|nr:glycine betaine/L-proline ABC transporter ATP-binding protein [Roseofilum casamattae]MDJ1183828.1 glycine betaine/L-proline ABC transporter ATP-binding protein [Roseofilum casamattae BLCC-M143]
MSNIKIHLENLIKIYGKKPSVALQMFRDGANRETILKKTGNVLGIADVSLKINAGELFVIMGLSGSGKSTLVRCLNRLIEPTSGHIYIDGEEIVGASQQHMREVRRKKMAMVFQKFGLFPHKTVVENVAYGLKVQGIPILERREKAVDILERVGLADWRNYFPSSLSGGMQQRVGLARALATDADILLMDEAFSALDPLIRREMQDELMRLQAELHKTIVFISHDIQEALKIGDRVAIMKDGALVQVGTPEELVLNPVDDYVQAFTQDVNRAQVLKIGTLARQTQPLNLNQYSIQIALEQMQQQNVSQLYVVNEHRKPVGLLHKHRLEYALGNGNRQLSELMVDEFPQLEDSHCLEAVFNLPNPGMAIAVTKEDGEFHGVLTPKQVLLSMGSS